MLYFTYFMMFVHTFVGVILIGIILLQRGRGGGLAGAFGGMGGQSAFGTKAGDVFTKITIYLATAWIVLGGVCVLLASQCKATKVQEGAKVGLKKAAEEKEGAGDAKADDKEKAADDKKAGIEGDAGPKPNPPDVKVDDVKTDGKGDVKTEDAKTEDAKTGVKPEDAGQDVKKKSTEDKDAPAEKPAEPKKDEPKKDDPPAEKEPTEKKPE